MTKHTKLNVLASLFMHPISLSFIRAFRPESKILFKFKLKTNYAAHMQTFEYEY